MAPATALLLLLAALLLPPATEAQPKYNITNYVGDELLEIDVNKGNFTTITIECPDPSTSGVSFKNLVTTFRTGRTYTVDLSYTRGDFNSLQEARKKLGPYMCITNHGDNRTGYAIVLSERRHPRLIGEQKSERLDSSLKTQFSRDCGVPTSGRIRWERYQEDSGLFKLHYEGRTLTISYQQAEHNQSVGFTIYRCYDTSAPERIEYYRVMKSKDLRTRQFRTSQYESTVLPHYIKPSISFSLECKGLGLSTGERPAYRFKHKSLDNETYYTPSGEAYTKIVDNYRRLTGAESEWSYQYDQSQSQIQIRELRPLHAGLYSCVKDKVLQRLALDIDYGEVYIKDYANTIYPMHGRDNVIDCEVSEKALRPLAYWLLKMKDRTLRLRPGTTVEGYKTSESSSGIKLEFNGSRPEAVGARLECQLPYTTSYTTIVQEKPKLILKMKDVDSYVEFKCRKEKSFAGRLKAAPLLADGSLGAELQSMEGTDPDTVAFFVYPKPKYVQVVCYTLHDGEQLRSNVEQYGIPDAALDIVVEGDRNPGRKVFLEGRDIRIACSFRNLPYRVAPSPDIVFLRKQGVQLPNSVPRTRLNSTDIEFVLRRATPADSGDYNCTYSKRTLILRSVSPLPGTYTSPVAQLSVCRSTEFVCDSTCKDRRLLCDKKQDCADGTDERPEYCSKCEPNEVRCKPRDGKSPMKRCVLKHWLCDGQDDCGNGYDEDLELHRKWCYKDSACTACQPTETCCPGRPGGKCIPRTYECDKELDCSPASEELKCSPETDCLRITAPPARQTIEKRVGDRLALTCVAAGTERPTINWRRNWAAIPKEGVTESNKVLFRNFGTGEYTVEGKLDFTSITKDMAGIYNCEAVNNCKRLLSYEIELKVSD